MGSNESLDLLSKLMIAIKQRNDAYEEIEELRECLRWYVENDDTMNTDYNEPWLKGKRRAMVALGMEINDE